MDHLKEKNKQLIIHQATICSDHNLNKSQKAGTIHLLSSKKIGVKTGKNFLVLSKIQLEGKKIQDIQDFIRGQPNFIKGNLK